MLFLSHTRIFLMIFENICNKKAAEKTGGFKTVTSETMLGHLFYKIFIE